MTMHEQKLAELHPKYTPEVLRQIAAEMQALGAPGSLGAAHCSEALPLSAEAAWKIVQASKKEWTVQDCEDFYEGITSAFRKIAARREPQNDPRSATGDNGGSDVR